MQNQEGVCRNRREYLLHGADFYAVLGDLGEAEQHAQCTDDVFLCDQAADGCDRCTPVAPTERCEDGCEHVADRCQDGLILFNHFQTEVKGLEEPDEGNCQENDRSS